jgi:heme oxygenase
MILTRLKHETAAAHRAIEHTVDLPSRLRSAGEYRRLLERFWGFYAPIEAQLAARPEWAQYDLDIHRRLKASALVCDLRALGLSASAIDRLPRCPSLPPLGSFAHALGCLYVLEGATLGGQIIAREARRTLGLTPDHGCAFFSSYGEHVGAMWGEFRVLLVEMAAHETTILHSAHETFAAFERWLASREWNNDGHE